VISHHTRVLRYQIALARCTLGDRIAPGLDEKTRMALTVVEIEDLFTRDPAMDRDVDHVARDQARAPLSKRLHGHDIDSRSPARTAMAGRRRRNASRSAHQPEATGSSLQRPRGIQPAAQASLGAARCAAPVAAGGCRRLRRARRGIRLTDRPSMCRGRTSLRQRSATCPAGRSAAGATPTRENADGARRRSTCRMTSRPNGCATKRPGVPRSALRAGGQPARGDAPALA
jgi:hypothetical protein